jgi:hypothetical protein
MLIKNNYAIINFVDPDHVTIAMNRFQGVNIENMPVYLRKIKEAELNKPSQEEEKIEPKPEAMEVEKPPYIEISPEILAIE